MSYGDIATEAIFTLEGPLGTAQLFDDGLGYTLFFEDIVTARTISYCRYAYRADSIHDAFNDAKRAVGLEDWAMTWDKFKEV
jgi:hypothetical protein